MTRDQIDSVWDYADPMASEQAFRELTVDSPLTQSEVLTQIARAQGLQQRFDDAHATLDRVQARLEQSDARVKVRYLLERGRVFNSSKQPQRATALFMEALQVADKKALDFYAVDALHMLAIAEPDPARQLDWNFRAMKLAEASKDPRARGWLASLYNNIGWTYYQQQRYDAALEVFRKAVALREQANKPMELRIAHYSVGKTLRAMGRIDEALKIQLAQERDAQEHNQPDGFICEEIAECLLAQGKANESRPYFGRAYELLSKDEWIKRDEPQRLQRIMQLSG